ncbi:MAG: hypothetical protein FJY74_08335 [Candidatus Eisenbacteria bacterium]|nr:hypothetical protein [Candidatus Eisenbacteria bacterium]
MREVLTRRVGMLLVPSLLVFAGAAQAVLVTQHLTDQQMLALMPESELSFTAEGRIGDRGGVATFELDIGRLTSSPSQTAQHNWQSGRTEPLTVAYDAFLNTASFTLGGVTLTYQPDRYFNEIFVRARAGQSGSSLAVSNLVLEGLPVGDVSQATGPSATDVLRISGANLYDGFSLTGTAVLSWQDPAPTQSNLAFQIKVGAVPANPIDEATWGRLKAIFK